MNKITISSSLLNPTSEKPLSPAMITALWVINSELDRQRIPANSSNSVWLKIPAKQLRGENSRDDNIWLRQCLDRLTGIKINGAYKGDPWGGVIISEWHIEQGGSLVKILVPPVAIQAIRSPDTFTKIETMAAYKLHGNAKVLYALLADKKNMNQSYWTFGLDELRELLNVSHKTSYQRWNNFRYRVLDPAIEQINDFGTVNIKMTPLKKGRSIDAVRFDWSWKSLDEARYTDEENQQPSKARHMDRKQSDAPPLTDKMHPIAKTLHQQIERIKWDSWFKEVTFEETEQAIKLIAPNNFIRDKIKELFAVELESAKDTYNSDLSVIVSNVDRIT